MADQHAQSGDDNRPTGIPAIRWEEPSEGPVLVLLDQTRLPAEEVELVCTDAPALVEAIRTLAVRGAPLLGIAGAYGVALAAARGCDVEDAAGSLEGARPTAVNLAVGVRRAPGRVPGRARPGRGPEAGRRGGARRGAGAAPGGRRGQRAHGAGTGWRCSTSCCRAAGTGSSRTATPGRWCRAVRARRSRWRSAAHRAGRLRRLWVDETRPLLQGARLTAYEAARSGMAYTLLTDNAAGSLFAAGEVDAVLVGADRIAADGSVANKVGSYPLAVLARYHHVPFIVVAPVTTVDPDTPDGASIEVEQRAGQEVTEIAAPQAPVAGVEAGGGIPVAPLGTQAYNPAFDVTPPELVTAIVTEEGAVSPVTAEAARRAVCQVTPGND